MWVQTSNVNIMRKSLRVPCRPEARSNRYRFVRRDNFKSSAPRKFYTITITNIKLCMQSYKI